MVTVAHVVKRLIEKKPFLQEALAKGLINNAALAEELIPDIKKELGKEVTFSAANMAVRRYGESLQDTIVHEVHFDEASDLSAKTDLVEVTLYKLLETQEYLLKVYDVIDMRQGDFLTVTQGLHEIMIITNQKHLKKLQDLLPKKLVKNTIQNLSSVTITIPETTIETLGFFYVVTKALNWENIPIIDIVSTYTELTFILKDQDTSRALDILREVIKAKH